MNKETIEDIVAEMRKRFEPYARSESNDARYTAYMGYAEFADRIEAAVKREDECYIVEWRDATFGQWRVYAKFLDRAKAEKKTSYLLASDRRLSKYRIVKKTIKQEVVYETGND